jgi:hypothetical protein
MSRPLWCRERVCPFADACRGHGLYTREIGIVSRAGRYAQGTAGGR